MRADSAGYVEVSVQNYSEQNVWFDDFRIVAVEEMVVQENHYDPFGQNLVDIELTGTPDCPEQYTGKERIRDGGLEQTDFGARYFNELAAGGAGWAARIFDLWQPPPLPWPTST